MEILSLWPSTPPGGGGPAGPLEERPNGAIRHIAVPFLEVHRPQRPSGSAMLIAAGGGYRQIQMEKEARPAAHWLLERGITAYILAYRLPGEGWRDGPQAPLQDALRAFAMVHADMRATPGERGVQARMGVLGFSAGAHLLGLATGCAADSRPMPTDTITRAAPKPDAAALIYPVITLEPPFDHTSTRRRLIGEHPSAEESARWSVQTHVGPAYPPVFLVQAEDDSIASVQNAHLMAAACARANVPVALHLLGAGGHGFAMGRADMPSAPWPAWYEVWLRAHDFC